MHELLTPAEMARADAAAARLGHPVADLIEAAGQAVAQEVRRRIRPCRALVLAGPGNNGGDGIAAARHLHQAGWPVAVAALAGRPATPCPVVPFAPEEAARADLVIDAVFGAGLARPLAPEVAEVLRAARRLVAVDVPSGVSGASGAVLGYAPQAEFTVTFFRRKPGHLLHPGRALCGQVLLHDIGIPPQAIDVATCWENTPALWTLPTPTAADHKYTRGHVTIIGGAEMTGAARLAAAGARRAGAGMVTIAARDRADVYRAGDPGLLVSEAPVETLLQDRRRTVWICGPGLGADTTCIPPLLASGRLLVLDADAIRPPLRGASVLTPHEGEFTRAFGPIGDDRLAAARAAAATTGAVVLLKGASTVIAAPDGRAAINANAPPTLATAGAGDVLAGIVGGLLGQGMAPFQAACAAAWLHGEAASLGGPALIAEDLPHLLARVRATM